MVADSPLLLGRVVVVAGEEPRLAEVAAAAADAGARVAVVSRTLPDDDTATVRFKADPRDVAVWTRLGMHVEQHLGPVDGVVTDAASDAVVRAEFDPDLLRRGHGNVARIDDAADVRDVLSRLCTPRAGRPRSAGAAADR